MVLTWVYRIAFGVIAAAAMLGNSLVIYILLSRRKTFLKKPYSIFILNLAIVDFLTGLALVFSRFIYLPSVPTYDDTAAEIFCLVIWSSRIPFDLGYISIFSCLSLAIERWIAVVKPQTYRAVKIKHAIVTVILVWLLGLCANGSTFFRIKYIADKKVCRWVPLPFATEEFPWVALTLQSIVPFSVMIALYAHIYSRIRNWPLISSHRESQLKKVTVVALLTCSALIIGWLPGRVTFMLSKYGYLNIYGTIHTSCAIFTFFNSCVNPWLYGIYSPMYQAEYKTLFRQAVASCNESVWDAFCRRDHNSTINRNSIAPLEESAPRESEV